MVLSTVASFDINGSFCSFGEGRASIWNPSMKSCERDIAASMSFLVM